MSHCPHSSRLEIVADSDATLLSRVCGVLGSLSLIPTRLESAIDSAGDTLRITIVPNGWTPRQLDLLRRKLSQLTPVHSIFSDAGEGSKNDSEVLRTELVDLSA